MLLFLLLLLMVELVVVTIMYLMRLLRCDAEFHVVVPWDRQALAEVVPLNAKEGIN